MHRRLRYQKLLSTALVASIAFGGLLLSSAGPAAAGTHSTYALGHAKKCKSSFVKRTLKHKVKGKKVSYVVCVYVAPPAPSGTITVYAALTTAGGQGFAQDFEKSYPKVTVNMVTGGTGALETQLQAQHQSGDVQADVIVFADPSSMGVLNQEHILSSWVPTVPVVKQKAPSGYKGSGWIAAFSFANVIIYHNGLANPPQAWTDLTNSALKGKVAIGDAGYSGTTFGWAAELSSKYGWSYFQSLKSNGARMEESTTTTGTDVASGKEQAAVTLDSVARSLLAESAPITIVWPSDGTIISPAPAGVTTTTHNQRAARAFVSWLVSPKGQQESARLGYDPVYTTAKPQYPVPANTNILTVPWNKVGKQRTSILSQFASIFG